MPAATYCNRYSTSKQVFKGAFPLQTKSAIE